MASRFECPRCQTVFVKDVEGDAAFVECPSCGALALPAHVGDTDLSRALSGSHPSPPSNTIPSPDTSPPMSIFGEVTGPGMVIRPAGGTPRVGPSAVATKPAPAPAFDFDLGADIDRDQGADPTADGTPPVAADREAPAVDPRSSTTLAEPPRTPAPAWDDPSPDAPVHMLPPDALAALAAAAEAGPTTEHPGPWSSLSEEAFGELDKAFDEMALRPPSRRELSREEARFLMGEGAEVSASGLRPPPLRPPARRPSPPPPPRKAKPAPRPRPTHFVLSDAARTLAFLPLRQAEPVAPPRAARPARRPDGRDDGLEASRPQVVEATDRLRVRAHARPPVPSVWRGLSVGRVAAVVVVCAILGGTAGAFTAPKPNQEATPRARASLQLADGNRFYHQGRYDDALGAYKAALVADGAFAAAWRARGVALAKLQRYDEAADAYRHYLTLVPDAPDAGDVKDAVARRGPPRLSSASP